MQSTGQTSIQASQPVQLSARMTASSLGSFFRALPAPLAIVIPRSESRGRSVISWYNQAAGFTIGDLIGKSSARKWKATVDQTGYVRARLLKHERRAAEGALESVAASRAHKRNPQMKRCTAIRSLPSACCGIFFSIAVAQADNWPQWRGPDNDGTCKETNLPSEWSATKNILWKLALPGMSGATPA